MGWRISKSNQKKTNIDPRVDMITDLVRHLKEIF